MSSCFELVEGLGQLNPRSGNLLSIFSTPQTKYVYTKVPLGRPNLNKDLGQHLLSQKREQVRSSLEFGKIGSLWRTDLNSDSFVFSCRTSHRWRGKSVSVQGSEGNNSSTTLNGVPVRSLLPSPYTRDDKKVRLWRSENSTSPTSPS